MILIFKIYFLRRRKAWEEEQLRKKIEAEIFGTTEGELKETEITKENHQPIEEIKSEICEKSKSRNWLFIILSILVIIMAVVLYQ